LFDFFILFKMKQISFKQIISKIKKTKFEKFDLIVAIGQGGIIPASLVADKLKLDMKILWLNFRDENNKIKYKSPKLTKKFDIKLKNKKILLVDDVNRTGKTLQKAKKLLKGNKIKTFVLNGKADYNIINSKECVRFPWR